MLENFRKNSKMLEENFVCEKTVLGVKNCKPITLGHAMKISKKLNCLGKNLKGHQMKNIEFWYFILTAERIH